MKRIVNLCSVIFSACSFAAVSTSPFSAFAQEAVLTSDNADDGSFYGQGAYSQTSYSDSSDGSAAFPNYFSGAGKKYASASVSRDGAYMRKATRRIRGTGFYVAPNMVLTNAHVVKSCGKIVVGNVMQGNGGRVVAIDKDADLAVVRTDASSPVWAKISRGDVEKGAALAVAGYPTEGRAEAIYEHFSSEAASNGYGEGAARFHFLGNVKKGNSGGPVLDAKGEVAGVVVGRVKLMFASADNGAFSSMKSSGVAISASQVRNFMARNGVRNPSCENGACASSDAKEFVEKLACIK
ncbi:MAG: serine protease [Rickettsiales bacterium]